MPRLRLIPAAALLAAASTAATGQPAPGEPDPRLLIGSTVGTPPGLDRVALELSLDPAGSRLEARARVATEHRRRLGFRLHPALEISALRCGDEDLLDRLRTERGAEEGSGRWELRVPRSCRGEDGRVELELEYAGVFDGDAARLLSGQGAHFAPGDAVSPELDRPALQELQLDLPAGWTVSRPPATLPLSGAALAAGPFVSSPRELGGTQLRVLLLEEDRRLAAGALDRLAVALPRLEALLGPHPAGRFDVVEAPVEPGPLPGGLRLRRPELQAALEAGDPGALERALARAWLSPEPAAWRDGLALFAAELAGTEDAPARRRRILRRLALGEASAAERFALVFEALRQELGPTRFTAALEVLTGRTSGRFGDRVQPHDLEGLAAAFAPGDGEEPPRPVTEWLGIAELPRLTLEDLRGDEGVLRGRLRREGAEVPRHVELAITATDGRTSRHRVELSGEVTELAIETPAPVHEVELDPDAHLPRRLTPEEVGPCLARTLAAPARGHELIVAHPIAPPDARAALAARAESYRETAERLAAAAGGRTVPAVTVAREEWNGSSIVLLGGPEDNPLTARIVPDLLEAGFDPTPPGFRAGTRRWLEPGDALLATVAHPERAGALVSVWMPTGDEALDSGRLLERFASEGWVAFRGARAAQRGGDLAASPATRIELLPPADPGEPAARLRASVEALVAPELEGRAAGTNGARRTAEWLAGEMEEAGLQAWDPRGFQHVFFWLLRDLPRQPKLFRELPGREGVETYECTPAAFWLPVPGQFLEPAANVELRDAPVNEPILVPLPEGLVWAGSLEEPAFRGLDLRGAAALVLDDAPLPPRSDPRGRARFERERVARYFELLTEVRRQEGETLIVLRPRDEAPFFPALAGSATLDRERDPELAAAFERDGERGVRRELSARLAAHPTPPVSVRLAFAGADLLKALRAEGPLEPGRRWWRGTYVDLRLRVTTERVFDRNLVGLALGARRLSEGVVLVGAHHDGLGWDAEGRFHESAVDDAAGTAMLLELARRLAEDPPPLTVAFASHGAGHWGDVGARSLRQAWPGHWPLLSVLRIDSAGRAGAPVELAAGEGAEPAAGLVESALAQAGLDVRKARPARGPWARTGVPVVSLRQDGGNGVSSSDEHGLEEVDFEELARLVDALEAAVRELASGERP